MEQDIKIELEKRMNEYEEVKKLKDEIEENEQDIIIRRKNIEVLESKLKIKELEKNVTILEELQNN